MATIHTADTGEKLVVATATRSGASTWAILSSPLVRVPRTVRDVDGEDVWTPRFSYRAVPEVVAVATETATGPAFDFYDWAYDHGVSLEDLDWTEINVR